jgi:hypothetical protein
MEALLIIATLVGIGCLVMGFVLLSQEIREAKDEKKDEAKDEKKDEKLRLNPMDPIMTRKDFIWMQDTREPIQQLRPFRDI